MAQPSPSEDQHPEHGASRLHRGQTCRNKATSQVVQVSARVVVAAVLAEETHCGAFLKSLMLKVPFAYRQRQTSTFAS